MKQIAILFAVVCAMSFMTSQAQAQCGGGGFSSGFRGGSFNSFSSPVYRQPVYRPVYGGSFGSGFGGYGVPYRSSGISIGIGRGFGGSSFGRSSFGRSSFGRGFRY